MSKTRVLIVDDEPSVLRALGLALSETGWEIETAGTAEAAAPKLRDGIFDVAIVDKNLPGASGLDLIREIRAAGAPTRIILITAYGSLASGIESLNLGVDAYLEKPFRDIFEMQRVVESVLKRRDVRWAVSGRPAARGTNRPIVVAPGLNILVVAPASQERATVVDALVSTVLDAADDQRDQVHCISSPARAVTALTEEPRDVAIIDSEAYADDLTNLVAQVRRNSPHTDCIILHGNLSLQVVKRLLELEVRAILEVPPTHPAFGERMKKIARKARTRKYQRHTAAHDDS